MSTVRKICKDVAIIGAGAAGMMCAIEAGKRGRRVILIDHARQLAEKIRFMGADAIHPRQVKKENLSPDSLSALCPMLYAF